MGFGIGFIVRRIPSLTRKNGNPPIEEKRVMSSKHNDKTGCLP